jgi:hypothetical protein
MLIILSFPPLLVSRPDGYRCKQRRAGSLTAPQKPGKVWSMHQGNYRVHARARTIQLIVLQGYQREYMQ